MQINVTVTDANNIVCTVVPPQAQTITIDRGIAGNGIASISTINIDGDEYLHIVFTNGTSSDVGPISATYYTGTSPINVNNTTNVISLGTVPVANGGTGLTSFTANGVPYASSTSALTTGSSLSFDGTTLSTTGLSNSGTTTLSGGTANGVAYLNGSKVLTSGSALTFDGTTLGVSNGSAGSTGISITGTYSGSGSVAFLNFQRAGGAVAGTLGYNDASTAIQFGTTTNHSTIFLQNNAEAMRLTSTGLGIGTSSPTDKLQVGAFSGNNVITIGAGTTGNSSLYFGDGTGADRYRGYINYMHTNDTMEFATSATEAMRLTSTGLGIGTSSPGGWGKTVSVSNTTTDSGFTFEGSTRKWGIGGGYTDGAMRFYDFTAAAERARIDSSGNLLVGTVGSSVARLYVRGSGTTSATASFEASNSSGATRLFVQDDGTTRFFGSSGSETARIDSSGNVGIGTSSPSYKLDVQTANSSNPDGITVRSTSSSSSAGAQLILNGYGNSWGIVCGSAARNSNALTFSLDALGSPSEKMRLDSAGNLGLGVTPSASNASTSFEMANGSTLFARTIAPQFGLMVNAVGNWYEATYKTTAAANMYLLATGQHQWYNAPSGTAGAAITFTQAMTLDASGNLLVGTTSGGSGSKLRVYASGTIVIETERETTASATQIAFKNPNGIVGTIETNGSLTLYNTTSDYRLKTVVGTVTDSGARIDALEPVEYTWNADGSRIRGFLAHKFQEVYAGSVTGTKDAVDADGKPVYQAMQAGSAEVIADLVAELQSLRKRLADAGIA